MHQTHSPTGKHVEALLELQGRLPHFSEVGSFADQESRARATLSWIIAEALAASDFKLVPTQPTTCPNCGVDMGAERSPYCSDACREEAAFVRQLRGSLAQGTVLDEERQVALGQKLWRILGGGLPLRQSLVLERTLNQVIKRYEGRCDACGAPATTIDHTGSG